VPFLSSWPIPAIDIDSSDPSALEEVLNRTNSTLLELCEKHHHLRKICLGNMEHDFDLMARTKSEVSIGVFENLAAPVDGPLALIGIDQ
jgi:hypothetical protein